MQYLRLEPFLPPVLSFYLSNKYFIILFNFFQLGVIAEKLLLLAHYCLSVCFQIDRTRPALGRHDDASEALTARA